MKMSGSTLVTCSPLPSIWRTLKKYPFRVIQTEPSFSTSQALGMRLSLETLHFRESTRTRFPSSENATLNSMSLEVNQMHPMESLRRAAAGWERRQALDIPGMSPIRERVFRSRMSSPPAPGTHSLPNRSSRHWLTMSPTDIEPFLSENLMKESPSNRTSPPPKVLIHAYPMLSK